MAENEIYFKLRRGTRELWAVRNPILRQGEPGVELDTSDFKIGDGVTPWNDLPYHLNEDDVLAVVFQAIADSELGSAVTETEMAAAIQTHVDSEEPHPNYDDGSSFVLRYENAKV
jgi:hypothetical protein